MTKTTLENPFLSTKEAAKHLGLAKITLAHWRMDNVGPVFYRVSPRRVMYRLADLDKWLQERRHDAGQ